VRRKIVPCSDGVADEPLLLPLLPIGGGSPACVCVCELEGGGEASAVRSGPMLASRRQYFQADGHTHAPDDYSK
jgi:hypothetical protein